MRPHTVTEAVTRILEAQPGLVYKGGGSEEVRPSYIQYVRSGNAFTPAGEVRLEPTLPPFAYRLESTMSGVQFVKVKPRTDELYEFQNSAMVAIMEEVDKFWMLKPNFQKLGLLHHRGILVHGPPGTGKSSLMQQVAERMVRQGNVVFFSHGVGSLLSGLKAFRDIEPDRKVVVVLEDLDEYLTYSERDLLQLLDGEDSVDNVLFLASTNYIQRFPPRLLRPGRFDRKVFLGFPPIEGRLTYLQHKLKGVASEEDIRHLAEQTDGMSFGHLRELVIAGFAFKEPMDAVLRRLRSPSSQVSESRKRRSAGGEIRRAVGILLHA